MVKFTLGVFSFIFLLFVFAYIESEAGNIVAIIVFIFIAVFIIGLIMASSNNKKIEEKAEKTPNLVMWQDRCLLLDK